jgi:hypothetical protein
LEQSAWIVDCFWVLEKVGFGLVYLLQDVSRK